MSITKRITNYNDPNSIGSKLRAKRIRPLIKIIEHIFKDKGRVRIIDIGGTETYWKILSKQTLAQNNVIITILNIAKPKTPENKERYRYLEGDACNLASIPDNYFDIVHSNSVIEHVGDWNRMIKFSLEVKRLAKHYYVQTPYYWFPIEPHCMIPFFHWLPKPIRVMFIMKLNLGNWKRQRTVLKAVNTIDSARLLDKKMFTSLFEEANITTEFFFYLPKSLIAIH